MRQSWNDDRLDDFRGQVEASFEQVDKRFESLERRMDAGFMEINARIDGMQRLLIQANAIIIAALMGVIATQL